MALEAAEAVEYKAFPILLNTARERKNKSLLELTPSVGGARFFFKCTHAQMMQLPKLCRLILLEGASKDLRDSFIIKTHMKFLAGD